MTDQGTELRDLTHQVSVLQDRLDITDVVYTYARAMDDCDWEAELLRS